MGGSISVQSIPESGTTFTFTIQTKASKNSVINYIHFNADGLQGKKVLVVDDNQTNCNILKSQLADWKFSPTLAPSAGQALKILSSDSGFELVITDMQMPDMDGVELALAIRKVNPALQIILLSSIGHEQRKQYDHLVFPHSDKAGKAKSFIECHNISLAKSGKTHHIIGNHLRQNFPMSLQRSIRCKS